MQRVTRAPFRSRRLPLIVDSAENRCLRRRINCEIAFVRLLAHCREGFLSGGRMNSLVTYPPSRSLLLNRGNL